jgi:DNA-binding NarL/FixJ family response regulator
MSAAKTKIRHRVMLVDDHMLMRMGLSFALSHQPDIEVVAEAEDGVEAVELHRLHRPDVVVLDLRMPKRNGIETLIQLRKEFRGARVLVLSNYSTGDEIAAALQAGAAGFCSKDIALPDLVAAIRQVAQGEQYLPSEISRRLAGRISSQLSAREFEVLSLIARGMSNKEIGAELQVAEATVKVHVTNLLAKLGVADRTQAILAGIKRGILHVE